MKTPSRGLKNQSARMLAALTAAALGLTYIGLGQAAWATTTSENSRVSTATVSESLTSAADLIAAPVSISEGASPIGTLIQGNGSITVPSDPKLGVTLASDNGAQLRIGLPNSDTAGTAQILKDGVTSYLGEDAADSVIITDYGVQMVTPIASKDAPNRYEYDLTLGAGQKLALTEAGLPAVFNANGEIDVAVATPWAQDANGNNVPTRYEVHGNTVTQVVDHSASPTTAYPVTADPIWLAPWILKCLFGLGLKGPDIAKIAWLGTPNSIGAAFGRAALACIFGK